MVLAAACQPARKASTVGTTPEIERRVEQILSQMTLAEKIGQMNQISGGGEVSNYAEALRGGQVGSILNEVDPAKINEFQRICIEESRLGIPLLMARDVIHGFHTVFPIPLGLAATFDPALVQEGARVAALEATAQGIRWTFSPMLDIARDPRWGRIAEGSGEDTYLDARMGEAMVRGYQGPQWDTTAMAACIKHFVGYGAAEGGRDYNSTSLTERQLRNVYLYTYGHFGVGDVNAAPEAGGPAWWQCDPNGKAGCSLYENTYTFIQKGTKLIWKNNGSIYTNENGMNHLGKGGTPNEAVGDFDVPYTPGDNLTFVFDEANGKLSLSDGAFLGFYTGVSE